MEIATAIRNGCGVLTGSLSPGFGPKVISGNPSWDPVSIEECQATCEAVLPPSSQAETDLHNAAVGTETFLDMVISRYLDDEAGRAPRRKADLVSNVERTSPRDSESFARSQITRGRHIRQHDGLS